MKLFDKKYKNRLDKNMRLIRKKCHWNYAILERATQKNTGKF